MGKYDKIRVVIEADPKKYYGGVDKARKKTKEFDKQLKKSSGGVRHFTSTLKLAGYTLAGLSFARLTQEILDNGLAFERINRTLVFVTDSAEEGAKAFRNISQMSRDLGLNLLITADSYAKFRAAAKGSNLEAEVDNIFLGVSTAVSALGLRADSARGIYRALEQMLSKGNVQAEELRGQLGERLPGALALAAKAMGITTKEINKMMDNGELMAVDLLPKLARLLKEEFGDSAVEASEQGVAAINRMSTAWDILTAKLYNSDAFSYAGNQLANALDFVSGADSFVNIKKTTSALSELHAQIKLINSDGYQIENTRTGHARRNFSEKQEKSRLTKILEGQMLELENDLQLAREASVNVEDLEIAAENIRIKLNNAEDKLLTAKGAVNSRGRGANPFQKIKNQIEKDRQLLSDIEFKIESVKDSEIDTEYKNDKNAEENQARTRAAGIAEITKASEKLKVEYLYTSIEKRRVLLNASFKDQQQAAKHNDTVNSEQFRAYNAQYLEAHQFLADEEVRINKEAQQKKLDDATDAQSGLKRALDDYHKSANDSAEQSQSLAKNAFTGLEEDFLRFTKTSKLSFSNMTKSIIDDLIKIALKKQALGLFENFSEYFDQPTSPGLQKTPGAGANNIGFAHGGAIIGKGFTFSRSVNSSVFQGANRYHAGGIAKNEVPAILQKGEGVFTVEQMKALTPAGNKNPTVRVNIINNTQSTATQSQTNNADGSTDIEVLIGVVDDALGEMFTLGTGSLFGAVESRG